MVEGIIHNPEQEQQLLTLRKIAETEQPNPKTVLYIPPVKGQLPSEDVLKQFSSSGNTVWAAEIEHYGQDLEKYTTALAKEYQEKVASAEPDTFVVGFSTGCPLAAE